MGVYRFARKLTVTVIGIGLIFCGMAGAADTVQVNIKTILNARAVSTFSNGTIYTWTRGIDGNGHGDGYVTHSVAVHQNRTDVLVLPDSARFPANANHPTMILNYSNSNSTDFQTHFLAHDSAGSTYSGIDSVNFLVPQGNYSKLYFALTSSEGGCNIDFVLTYSDGPVKTTLSIPDYAQGLSAGSFYVDSNMAKWNNQNAPVELTGHNLNGIGVTANSSKILTSVKLIKRSTSSYLVLWGVTGVATITTVTQNEFSILKKNSMLDAVNAVSTVKGIRLVNLPLNASVKVFSADGSVVSGLASINNRKFSPGVYVVELRSGNESKRLHVAVAR
jgi:hypothetical protein